MSSFTDLARQHMEMAPAVLKDIAQEEQAELANVHQLRAQKAIEKEKYEEAKQQATPDNLVELGRQLERQKELGRHIAQLEAQNKLEAQSQSAQQSVIRQSVEVASKLREQLKQLEDRARDNEAWDRLLREFEERLRELEQEATPPEVTS
jgi:hypothetical protein